MSAQEFAAQLKQTIQDIKDNGTAAIYCDNLISYLDDISKSPSQPLSDADLERYKADLQLHIEQSKSDHASQLEMFRAIILAGQNAIRSSFLLNGGASIALLAFIGHLARISPDKVITFVDALIPFTLGVLVITITSGCTYLSQWLYDEETEKSQKWGFRFNLVSIILGISSYFMFVWGIWCAYSSFKVFV